MKKSIIELSKESFDTVFSEFVAEIRFVEIQKWESYYHCDCQNGGEDYQDVNGEVIMGYLVYEEQLISPEVYDEEFEVSKEIYILPNGDFEVFYASHKGEYDDKDEKERGIKDHLFWKTTRIRSKEKSLSQIEIQDILFEILTKIKKKQ